jgi:hypothetical protein
MHATRSDAEERSRQKEKPTIHLSHYEPGGFTMLTPRVADPLPHRTEQSKYTPYVQTVSAPEALAHDARIGVGFGHASITCDGVPVFEEDGHDYDALPTVADAERMAGAKPKCDWCIHLVSLLDERHYRREGEGRWVLYKRGYGLS